MTPFFRKIRKNLANENKFQKYSRYAIGEILLVVIGILIALQINNWNEDRKLILVEKELLIGIKNDILRDTLDMNNNLRNYSDRIQEDSIVLSYLLNRKVKTPEFEKLLYINTIRDFKLDLHRSFYESAKQLGLSIIKNDSLRNAIISLYEWTYPNMLTAENSRETLDHFTMISPSFLNFFEIDTTSTKNRGIIISDVNYKKIINNKNLHFKITELMRIHKELRRRTFNTKNKALTVLAAINSELSN